MNLVDIKKRLFDFTIQSVENFITENPELEFYSFAFDCDSEEYAGVHLCFNTENEFNKTLKQYQNGKFSHHYVNEEQIFDLKFNTGDWRYQGFDSISFLTIEERDIIYDSIPNSDYKNWEDFLESIMKVFCEVLIEFRKTETYKKILKTEDFISFCIDHNEDFEPAIMRLKKYE